MKIATVADVKAKLSAYLKESENGPVVVTRNGRPVAVLVAVRDDDEVEQLLLAHSPRLRTILEASRKQIQEGQGLSHDDFWGETAAAPKPPEADEKPPPPRKGKRTKRKKAG